MYKTEIRTTEKDRKRINLGSEILDEARFKREERRLPPILSSVIDCSKLGYGIEFILLKMRENYDGRDFGNQQEDFITKAMELKNAGAYDACYVTGR
ncbi:MAG: hypothetical protein PVJ67_01580 [Candidatus Pacearchaeota archaeon]|jgi:hypothetical protein